MANAGDSRAVLGAMVEREGKAVSGEEEEGEVAPALVRETTVMYVRDTVVRGTAPPSKVNPRVAVRCVGGAVSYNSKLYLTAQSTALSC